MITSFDSFMIAYHNYYLLEIADKRCASRLDHRERKSDEERRRAYEFSMLTTLMIKVH